MQNKVSEFVDSYEDFIESNKEIIDLKHQNILQEVEKNSSFRMISEKNLREWKMQTDVGAPISIKYLRSEQNLIFATFKYIFRMAFQLRSELLNKKNLLLDLEIIKLAGASEILKENPVDKTPGNTRWYKFEGYVMNERWLRYVYLAHRMLDNNMIGNNGIWVDIGSFYGGLQSIMYRYQPKSVYVLVDFKHQLLRSYLYLSTLFPDSNHTYGNNIKLEDLKEGSFIYLSIDQIELLDKLQISCVTNFFSFGEMKREFFQNYINSNFFRNSESIYMVNRVVSAPFFEPTYDSDLNVFDYQFGNFKVRYFDIFPIHHFMQIQRKIQGKVCTVNASSSYFEMQLKKT